MARKSSYLVGGLAIAVLMIGALPAAHGIAAQAIAASTKQPIVQVNRGSKGDRLAVSHSIAVKKAPVEVMREPVRAREQTDKRKLMDGCDPLFSPVSVPSLAHLTGRCVG
jgi:hypothetical protein